jgi:hypothetical protein
MVVGAVVVSVGAVGARVVTGGWVVARGGG